MILSMLRSRTRAMLACLPLLDHGYSKPKDSTLAGRALEAPLG